MPYSINSNLRQFVEVDSEKLLDFLTKRQAIGLIPLVQEMIAVGRQMNINPIYILAHAILESAWGKSRLAVQKHNLFGYGAADDDPFEKAYVFPTAKNCLWYVMGKIAHRYLSPKGKHELGLFWGGEPSLLAMNKYYASDIEWADKICKIMNQISEEVVT